MAKKLIAKQLVVVLFGLGIVFLGYTALRLEHSASTTAGVANFASEHGSW